MIKCDLGETNIIGPESVVLAECSTLLGEVKSVLAERHGEEYAERRMKHVIEAAFLSKEQINDRCEKIIEEIIQSVFGGAPVALAA